MSWQEEKLLVALMLKIAMLATMERTCYSFAGKLYRQVTGAGIGLRASACMAKLVMGLIDKMWGGVQHAWNIRIYLYFRYIDDLRIFMHPISEGWRWGPRGWEFTADQVDARTPSERTKEEIKKSLNAVTDFIQFTTEGEEDFNGFLPTLDFQTQVQDTGKILFKFFNKPMANNVTLQRGTGLSKSVIFSSLRQELIRRMLNSSTDLDWDIRLSIVSDFIQLLVNSGHRYSFIKSVILQAITKYKFMVRRSVLDKKDARYRPLYRPRSYDQLKRKICKLVGGKTWFKGNEIYDQYKNEWKSKIAYRHLRRGVSSNVKGNSQNVEHNQSNKEILTTLFVPASKNSLLLKSIMEAENSLAPEMDWRVKIVEQSGFPLGMCFVPKFPLLHGCPKGEGCILCGNTGVKCNKKGVIYQATCDWCKNGLAEVPNTNESNLLLQVQQGNPDGSRSTLESIEEEEGDGERSVAMNGMNKNKNGGGK